MTPLRKFAKVISAVHDSSKTGPEDTEGHLILTRSGFVAVSILSSVL